MGMVEKKYHLAYKHQDIIIFMFNNNNIITFKNQNIYKNNDCFKKAMKQMHDNGIVNFRKVKIDRWYCNQYKLSLFGEHIGEIINRLRYE